MLLVIDVGNTNVVLGLYRGGELVRHWRIATAPWRTPDEYAMTFNSLFAYAGHGFEVVKAVALSSVVPSVTPTIVAMCREYLNVDPLTVDHDTDTGLTLCYDNPQEIGADRIVNAVAAYDKYGGPLVVVDFGTATTFDVVSAGGAYLGGAIAPGIGISVEALFARAARLSRVELTRPPAAIGRTTENSLQSGIVFGFAGQVDAVVRRIAAELEGQPRVIATGGLAELVAAESETIEEVDQLLALIGLRLVYERNAATGPAGG